MVRQVALFGSSIRAQHLGPGGRRTALDRKTAATRPAAMTRRWCAMVSRISQGSHGGGHDGPWLHSSSPGGATKEIHQVCSGVGCDEMERGRKGNDGMSVLWELACSQAASSDPPEAYPLNIVPWKLSGTCHAERGAYPVSETIGAVTRPAGRWNVQPEPEACHRITNPTHASISAGFPPDQAE